MKGPEGEVHDPSTLAARSPAVSRTDAALVLAFLAPPSAWALNLGLAYALVDPAARTDSKTWLWASALSCSVLTLLAALLACAVVRKLGSKPMPEGASVHTRALAVSACVLSAFFLLAIVAQTLPLFGLGLHDR